MFHLHSVIPFLHYLWMLPIFGLAAGASALGGAAGETVGAIIGSAGEGGGEGDEGTSAREGAGAGEGEGAGTGEGEGGAAAAQGAESAQGADKGADGRKMPAALRSHIAELKAAGKSDLAKEINTVFWGFKKLQSDLAQAFPGGLKEAVELKTQLEEAGGLDSIQELQGEVQEWRGVDEQIANGDPAVLKSMFEEFPDGMKQLMPSALDNWANLDADGYDRHMAGVAYSTVQSSGIPTDLALAYSLLEQFDLEKNPSLKRVASLIAKGYNWIGNLGKFAAEKPAAAASGASSKKDGQLTEREQRVAANERKQVLTSIGNDFKGFSTPKLEAELKAIAKGKELPAGGKQELFKLALVNVFKVLGAGGNAAKGIKSKFEAKYDAYLDAGDQQGAAQLLRSRAEPLLAKAMQDAYKWLYGEATLGAGKKGAQGGNGQGGAAGAGKGGNAAAGDGSNQGGGFELIAYDPKPESIDRGKTTRQMIFKNQAILKSGKKVTWRKGAPAEK